MRTELRLAAVFVLGILGIAPVATAARPGMLDLVVSAQRCSVDGMGDCGMVLSAIIPGDAAISVRSYGGMLLGVKTEDAHPSESFDVVLGLRATNGLVGTSAMGRFVGFRGFGFIDDSSTEEVTTDDNAYWYILENGAFGISIAGRTFTGRGLDAAVTFAEVPAPARNDEVGHWLSLAQVYDASGVAADLFVAAPIGDALEGFPEIAVSTAGASAGETGHGHGHLDYLKKVGDPATGRPNERDQAFDASGTLTFEFDDGREAAVGVSLQTLLPGTLRLDLLGLSVPVPYRVLPLTTKELLFQGPAR